MLLGVRGSASDIRQPLSRFTACILIKKYAKPRFNSQLFLQVFWFELLAQIDRFAGNHKDALAPVVDRFRILWESRHMRLHHLPDEKAVLGDLAAIVQLALEVCVTLPNQGNLYFVAADRRKAEFFKLVNLLP